LFCNRNNFKLINIKLESYHNSTTTEAITAISISKNNQTLSYAKQQQSFVEDLSFDIDNVTFSHHMTSGNGIQLHYVTDGKGGPIVVLHAWLQTWYEWQP
jgi:hypothetical protein